MSKHSIAEARNRFSELIARAEKGEEVIITRHGQPIVRLAAVAEQPAPKGMSEETVEWLIANRVPRTGNRENSVTVIRHLRDEDPE